jgi:hypothetical protein
MLNRSKIAIAIDSSIRARTFRIQVVQQNRVPYQSRLYTTSSIICVDIADRPRRTAPFPNGDVPPEFLNC